MSTFFRATLHLQGQHSYHIAQRKCKLMTPMMRRSCFWRIMDGAGKARKAKITETQFENTYVSSVKGSGAKTKLKGDDRMYGKNMKKPIMVASEKDGGENGMDPDAACAALLADLQSPPASPATAAALSHSAIKARIDIVVATLRCSEHEARFALEANGMNAAHAVASLMHDW